MRSILLLGLLAASVFAQSADDQILTEFRELMSAASLTEDGTARPDEVVTERRMKAVAAGLDRFLARWSPRAGTLRAGRLTLAKALALAGKPAEAVPHFRAFLTTDPSAPEAEDAELALGTSLLDAKDHQASVTTLKAFLERHPKSAQLGVAHYYLGVAQWQAGAHDAALASLDAALRTAGDSPISADAALQRLELLRATGRVEDARKAFEALKAAHPEAPWLLSLGEQLAWIGREAPELVKLSHFVQGEAATLAALRGRIVVLNFFAERYEACQAELKTLAGLAGELGDNAVFVGITKHYTPYDISSAADQDAALKKVLAAQGAAFRVAIAADFDNLRNYGVRGIPYTVVIGRDGRVVHLLAGGTRRNDRARADFAAAVRRAIQSP